jgi:signal transduction histidine kinase
MIDSMISARERIGKLDIAIAAVLSALGLLLMYANVVDLNDGKPPTPDQKAWIDFGGILPAEFALPMFLFVTVPLLWRRVSPLAAVGASLAGLVVNEVLIGTDLLRCGVVLPTALFFAFTAGAQLDGRESRIGLGLAVALPLVDFTVSFGPLTTAVMVAVTAAIWGVGRIAGSRGRMADELKVRTEELREARDERARMEVATDRTRISHELDELLQRRLGELARLADEGTRPSDGATATATLAEIERESRRTLEEMRAVVGVLRDDSAEVPTTPQPTLTHLEALLVRAKGEGARLAFDGSPRVLPAAVELSAYRIVEQLLAALDDAPGVEVRVRFGDDALELAVSGPARRRAKASIERASERARLARGTLEATIRAGRAEAVASLPLLSSV